MVTTRISSIRVCVADPLGLSRLLGEVPQGEELREELSRPYFTRRWQQSKLRSFWIASDGTTVTCLTVSGLEVDESLAVWFGFDDYCRRPGFAFSANGLSQVIRTELGIDAEIEG
jgi:hypothetical protein